MDKEQKQEEIKKELIDKKALIISVIIVAIIIIPIMILLLNKNDKKEEENIERKEVVKGCITCESDSGICCPYITESAVKEREFTELEIKQGCIKCNSKTGKSKIDKQIGHVSSSNIFSLSKGVITSFSINLKFIIIILHKVYYIKYKKINFL